jgi:hypothetical protein
MCFSEFIGYTCGHSSPEVLRPCPLTTQFYTNPVCTKHARRPILAPEMCPACQRVIHGRAVLISEWEHRWMHERGACGCDVQFPDLIRPRVVSRNCAGESIGAVGQLGDKASGSTNQTSGSKGVPAHYQERTVQSGQHNLEVAVRIPSLYGAEWVGEHRQLHKDGSCKCAGDFSFYQTAQPIKIASSTSALLDNGPGQGVRTKATTQTFQDQGHRIFQNCAASEYLNPGQGLAPQLSPSRELLHNSSDPHLLPPHQGDTLSQQSSSSKAASLEDTPSTSSGLKGASHHTMTSSKPPPLVVSSYYPHTNAPQRSPGAIYEVDPTKSTNRLYNHACNGGARMTTLADFQSVEFPRAEGYLPLVGLPIGAGPEGAPGLSHVGEFEDCVLHTKNLIACLGDEPSTCLLATKSKSFACLHDAWKGWEDADGLGWQQEDRARSTEPSEYGDSGAEEDQLYLS